MLYVKIDNVNYPIRNIIFEKIKQLGYHYRSGFTQFYV